MSVFGNPKLEVEEEDEEMLRLGLGSLGNLGSLGLVGDMKKKTKRCQG